MQSKLHRPKAFLFDFDGVIGNTMNDNYEAWKFALSQFQTDIKKEDYFELEGLKASDVASRYLSIKNIDTSDNIQAVVKMKEQYYLEKNSFSVYPNVENILSVLKENNILLGIVTGASRERLSNKKMNFSFEKYFNVVVTSDDYSKGKPSSEPYLLGVSKLNVSVEDCIVVENAPLGIESAKGAGIYTVAVCSTLPSFKLASADLILDNIGELEELVQWR